MNTFIKTVAIATLGLAAFLTTFEYVGAGQPDRESQGESQGAAQDMKQCPPDCGVSINVGRASRLPPSSGPETLEAKAGATVAFSSNVLSRVIFTGATPFIDERGNRVFQFLVDDSIETRLQVSDDGECSVAPGCKYIIIDATNPTRPARDPYIIVRR